MNEETPRFVKIFVTDETGRLLEHWYVRTAMWGVPAGAIDPGETPVDAAMRELLERTGYEVKKFYIESDGTEEEGGELFARFKTTKEHLRKVAAPGVRGGYETKIRWTDL